MVIFSGPMRMSLTSSRSTFWRSSAVAVAAFAPQLGEEAFQVAGEGEVGVPVGGLCVEGVDLAAQVRLAGAEVRHPRAQLIDGDQLLGERLDHGGDRGGGLGQRGLQPLALAGDRVGGAGGAPRPAMPPSKWLTKEWPDEPVLGARHVVHFQFHLAGDSLDLT